MMTSKLNLNFYLRRVFGVNGRIEFRTKRFPNKNNPNEKDKVILVIVNIPLMKDVESIKERLPSYNGKTLSRGRIVLTESEDIKGIYYLTGIMKCTNPDFLLKTVKSIVDRMMFTIFGNE